MAWTRQVRRNGQNLRGRFTLCSKERKKPSQGSVGYLRTLRAEVRGGERKVVSEFDKYRAAAKKLAEAPCRIRTLQSMFDEAVKYAPPKHWAGDGVRDPHGSSLMAHFLLNSIQVS